jgi:hypothetical protein
MSSVAYAQLPIGFGIKAGVALTDAYAPGGGDPDLGPYTTQSYTKDYIVGPFVDLRLPLGLGAEADALYRPVSLQYISFGVTGSTYVVPSSMGRYTTWEFPILAKYRLPLPHIKPMIEIGPSFRAHASGAMALQDKGFTVGGGVEFKLPLIRLSSDLRYTRWASSDLVYGNFTPNRNQVELLFGISF